MNRNNKIFPQMKEMKGLQVVIYCFIKDLVDTQQRNLLSNGKRNERHGLPGQ